MLASCAQEGNSEKWLSGFLEESKETLIGLMWTFFLSHDIQIDVVKRTDWLGKTMQLFWTSQITGLDPLTLWIEIYHHSQQLLFLGW